VHIGGTEPFDKEEMVVPEIMHALVQSNSGFAEDIPSAALESLEPYLTEATIPTPTPSRGEVLIKVRMSPVNPSDVAFISGVYGQPRVAGRPAGFEAVGEVVASGGGLMANRLVGKRVSFFAGVSGSWAEYAVAAARTCIPLRAEVADEDGAALLVNPFSAWVMYGIVRRSGAKAFLMTAGASQLGKLMVSLASEGGLRPISLVRRNEHIEPLRALGATHVLNTEAPDFEDALHRLLQAEKPRILLDALSNPLAQSVFLAMGPRSRWIVYGGLDYHPVALPDPGQLIFRSKRVEGFWLTSWLQDGSILQTARAARGVQARFVSGTWKTDVAAIVPMAEAFSRVPALLGGANQGKVMIAP
jgi:NADPH:quinone reductase-like Zn-dependent oxidoreductase